MSWSEGYLRGLATETGFRADTLEKALRLGEIVSDFSRHPLLSSALALKGGTALNLCFGPPARLSVDLDFNYVGVVERARMLEARPEVERAVQQIAGARGYQVQKSREEHAGRKYFLTYSSASGSRDRIELDLNFLYRVPILPVAQVTLWQPVGVDEPIANTSSLEEICAGKLCALLDRSMPRDLYDAARLGELGGGVLASEVFRGVFVAMAATLKHPVYTYGRDRVDRVTTDEIRTQLYPMLKRGDRPTAKNLREKAWQAVAPLVSLIESEREFTDRIQSGELRPELLFPNRPDIVERLEAHPALLWKVENAREHNSRGRRTRR